MCTALNLKNNDVTLFGRTMDIEYDFGQSIVLVPRNFEFKNNVDNTSEKTKYAILGMANILGNHALFADAFNEKGLSCAGLTFKHCAIYSQEAVDGKKNLAPYDLILNLLANFETVDECKNFLVNLNLVHKPIHESLPVPALHWMVSDKNGASIVVEQTIKGLEVYDNPVGVMTNAPDFNYHLTNLTQFMGLTPNQPQDTTWSQKELKSFGIGYGSIGLPGDSSSASRFIKASYLRSNIAFSNSETSIIDEAFHIFESVSITNGSTVTPSNQNPITLYTSCMNQNEGIYYYTTYNNRQISAINMFNEDLNSNEIKNFGFVNKQNINFLN